jgi:hypothetical protein
MVLCSYDLNRAQFPKAQRQKQPPPPSAPPPNATSKILEIIKSLPVAFGGGRVGVVLCFAFQRKLNHAYHPVDVFHHIVIPEPNHLITQRLKVLCSFSIVFNLVKVLAAIQFNYELLFDTAEIGDIVSNGVLSSKIHP